MLQSAMPPSRRAGGVGYQVDLLSRELARRGHAVTVFTADESWPDAPYRSVRVPLGGEGRARRIVAVGRAFAGLDLSPFDAVHAHGDDWGFGRRARVRTFYGSGLMEAAAATSWLRRGSQLCHYGLEWVASAGSCTVAISARTRRALPLVRRVVPCAYDPSVFAPGGERTPHPSVLFVAGTLAGRKRGALLLAAFAQVRRAIPGASLTVVSRDEAAGDGVTTRSGLAADELAALYRSHWVLCSTSSYEGFGVPYVEAMASGLPVVTTANAGADEVLDGGRLGVVCTPDALAGELVALLRDEGRRAALSARGLGAAPAYRIDTVATEYERLYAQVAR